MEALKQDKKPELGRGSGSVLYLGWGPGNYGGMVTAKKAFFIWSAGRHESVRAGGACPVCACLVGLTWEEQQQYVELWSVEAEDQHHSISDATQRVGRRPGAGAAEN